jgi:hypothetical protein
MPVEVGMKIGVGGWCVFLVYDMFTALINL